MARFNLLTSGSTTALLSSDRPCQENENREKEDPIEATRCFYTYEIFLDVEESWMPTAKVRDKVI